MGEQEQKGHDVRREARSERWVLLPSGSVVAVSKQQSLKEYRGNLIERTALSRERQ